jgi:hypothetical protein
VNLALWIATGLLSVAYLIAGGGKLIMPKEKIAATGAASRWVEDFSPGALKTIATLELLAAMSLILPAALDIAPILVPLAALGLVMLMVGAVITRIRRHEAKFVGVPTGSMEPRCPASGGWSPARGRSPAASCAAAGWCWLAGACAATCGLSRPWFLVAPSSGSRPTRS